MVASTYSYSPFKTSLARARPISCAFSGLTSPGTKLCIKCLAKTVPLVSLTSLVLINCRWAVAGEQPSELINI